MAVAARLQPRLQQRQLQLQQRWLRVAAVASGPLCKQSHLHITLVGEPLLVLHIRLESRGQNGLHNLQQLGAICMGMAVLTMPVVAR